jgi:hypothetical protein
MFPSGSLEKTAVWWARISLYFLSNTRRRRKMFQPIQTKLVGVTFDDCQASIRKWGCQDIGFFRLEREPNNQHDPNAVSVWFLNDRLGYLQKSVAERLAPLMDAGRTFDAVFVSRNEWTSYENVGLTIRIVETQ